MLDRFLSSWVEQLKCHVQGYNTLTLVKVGLQIRVRTGNLFFSSQTYVVGTQNNHFNETVLLSTKTHLKFMCKKKLY